MGIPDTYTMPIHDSRIFTGTTTVEETTSSNTTTCSNNQEHMPPTCTQLFCTAFFYYKKDRQQLVSLDGDLSSNSFTCQDIKKAINIKKFTAAEIKKATGNYSKQNIIGQGGQGIVYKGILLPSNQLIAVKRPYEKGSSYMKEQFVNEINVLSQINHRNVVKFLGCCFETKVPSIVYEYIPNGTLYDHLFDEQNPCVLTWDHRLRIASQVAEVLAYLHHTIREPIIHRDIKPRNILLHDNYMAKVSDFGISKFGPCQDEFNTSIEHTWEMDTTHVTTEVMGTIGYIDPEYVMTGTLTAKSDVSSFGVVLAELLTRKKSAGELAFEFLKKLKDGSLVEILDEQLVEELSMELLMKVAHLTGRCLEEKGEDRPTMRQVLRDLQDISAISGQQMLMRAQQLWRNTQ